MALRRLYPGKPRYIAVESPAGATGKLKRQADTVRAISISAMRMSLASAPEDSQQRLVGRRGVSLLSANRSDGGKIYALHRSTTLQESDLEATIWAFPFVQPRQFKLIDICFIDRYQVQLRSSSQADPILDLSWHEVGADSNQLIVDSSYSLLGQGTEFIEPLIEMLESRHLNQSGRGVDQAWREVAGSIIRFPLSQDDLLLLQLSKRYGSIDGIEDIHAIPERSSTAHDDRGETEDTLLRELAIRQRTVDEARNEMNEIVARARSNGVTWVAIGETLGIRGETAYQRFSPVGRESHRRKVARQRAGNREEADKEVKS